MSRFATILMCALAACGSSEAPPADAPTEAPAPAAERDSTPEGVAAVAKQIKATPDKQEEILKSSGWTAAEFEAALWEIAEDPAKSKAYQAALNG